MASKTTMRKELRAAGAYYSSETRNWVHVGLYGAVEHASMEEAYEKIDAIRDEVLAFTHHLGNANRGW